MRLVKWPCKIVGLRVGEVSIDLIHGPGPRLMVNYLLLRDPEKSEGIHSGLYEKNKEWSDKVREALEVFIEALEEEALPEIFEVEGDDRLRTISESAKESEDKPLSFPTLGGD